MKQKNLWMFAVLCAVNVSTQAQNQCVDDRGQKIFSDMPCINNDAKEAPLSAERRAKRERDGNRNQILNEGGAPRELVQAFERCARAIETKSKPMLSACLGEDPNMVHSNENWKKKYEYWQTIALKKTIIKSGRIEGYMGYLQIEGEQDGQRYSGSVEFRNANGWKPKLNLISTGR